MDNGFTGLPPTLVSEFLDSAGKIAAELSAPLKSIAEKRETLRARLAERDLLLAMPPHGDPAPDNTTCGIDLSSGTIPAFGAGLVCSAAFAAEGMPVGTTKPHWDSPQYNTVIQLEKQGFGTPGLLHAVACELACELAASAPHDIILYNRSTLSLFQVVMESLVPAVGAKQAPSSMAFLKHLKPALAAFGKLFMAGNGGNLHVGLPRFSPKQELSQILELSLPVDDTMVMTALLDPGEATSPIPIESDELKKTAVLPIKDTQLSAIRDRIVEAIRSFSVIYYRPYEWTPALRIELPGPAAADGGKTAAILAAISRQCTAPGSRQPYPLKRAEDLAGKLPAALRTIGDYAASAASKDLADDTEAGRLASLFSLAVKP